MKPHTDQHRRGLHLEYFTVGYNALEASASITFGIIASSIALLGFGLDSIVESLSGLILIWRLYDHHHLRPEEIESKENTAVKFVGATFIILGLYILYESIDKLIANQPPETTLPGICIAIASLIVMPVLAKKKRIVGIEMNSRAMIADSKETFACAWLSAALLFGLGMNYLFHFWQADPIAGLVISAFLFREGWENLKGDED